MIYIIGRSDLPHLGAMLAKGVVSYIITPELAPSG